MPERLFVVLRTEPFEDFRDFGKLVEVRAYGGQFTEKFVYEGRKAELRKGYSFQLNRPEREWRLEGTVGEVYVGPLCYIFEQVGDHRLIEPISVSFGSAYQENRLLYPEKSRFIGFEVIL